MLSDVTYNFIMFQTHTICLIFVKVTYIVFTTNNTHGFYVSAVIVYCSERVVCQLVYDKYVHHETIEVLMNSLQYLTVL